MESISLQGRFVLEAGRDRRVWRRVFALLTTGVLYVAVFPLLFPSRGPSTAALSLVLVVMAGWWFGLRPALAAGIGLFFLNTSLISAHSGMPWADVVQLSGLGSAALLISGAAIGRFHGIEVAARREMQERRRAELALTQQHAVLEQTIAERTAELREANQRLESEIAERKQVEAELQAALATEKELNQLKLRFTSMVSHEFRTPLTVIQSSADILRRYSAKLSDESKADKLERIQTQVEHMVGLLNDVLSISRADSVGVEYNPRLADLRDECRVIAREFEMTGGSHHIAFSTDDSPVLALVDPKLLRQALTNLISNAMKYSARGTTVSIAVRAIGDDAVIRVRDQGIGIPEEDRAGLFEMFHRANNVGKVSGSGLGLTITKQAVEAHGGAITFESMLNRGTEFTICLPAVKVDV